MTIRSRKIRHAVVEDEKPKEVIPVPPAPPVPAPINKDMETLSSAMLDVGKSVAENSGALRAALTTILSSQNNRARVQSFDIIPDLDKNSPRYGMIKRVVPVYKD